MFVSQKNLEQSVKQYVSEEVNQRSTEVAEAIGSLCGSMLFDYQYNYPKNQAISYVFPTIPLLKKVGAASKCTLAVTDKLRKLDPKKITRIFGDAEQVDRAFKVIRTANVVSTATKGLYEVGARLFSDTWDFTVSVGGYLGCPNPLDYVPETMRIASKEIVQVTSNCYQIAGSGAFAYLTGMIMDSISLEKHIKVIQDKALPQMLAKINHLFDHIRSKDIGRILTKSLAKSIQLESIAEKNIKSRLYDESSFDYLTPNEQLFRILRYYQENDIFIPGLSNEMIDLLDIDSLDRQLEIIFETYLNTQFLPTLLPMIVPEHIEALSHFFGVMLDMPSQDVFKSSLTKILSENFLNHFSDPQKFKSLMLDSLGGKKSVEKGELLFTDERKIKEILDFWLLNRKHPSAEDALDILKSLNLVHLESDEEQDFESDINTAIMERTNGNYLQSKASLIIGKGIMELSQKPSWKLTHLFFLEGLRVYLEKTNLLMEIEKLPQNESITEGLEDLHEERECSLEVRETETAAIFNSLITPSLGSKKGKIISKISSFMIHNFKSIRRKIDNKIDIDIKKILYGRSTVSLKTNTLITRLNKVLKAISPQEKQVVKVFLKGYLKDYTEEHGEEALGQHIEMLLSHRDEKLLLREIKQEKLAQWDGQRLRE